MRFEIISRTLSSKAYLVNDALSFPVLQVQSKNNALPFPVLRESARSQEHLHALTSKLESVTILAQFASRLCPTRFEEFAFEGFACFFPVAFADGVVVAAFDASHSWPAGRSGRCHAHFRGEKMGIPAEWLQCCDSAEEEPLREAATDN